MPYGFIRDTVSTIFGCFNIFEVLSPDTHTHTHTNCVHPVSYVITMVVMFKTTTLSLASFTNSKNPNLGPSNFSNSNSVIKFQHICGKQNNFRRRRERNWMLKSSNFFFALNKESSSNLGITATSDSKLEVESASNVVRKFYGGINCRDLSSVEALIADNCVYEDLIFSRPFVGRKAILEFFEKFSNSISKDLQFVIDDISTEDTTAVGVTWHLEWKGKPFPFSKGCSFYKLEIVNGQRRIIYGRDIVEPAIKPGETALVAIRGVTWLLQQFPQLAERF